MRWHGALYVEISVGGVWLEPFGDGSRFGDGHGNGRGRGSRVEGFSNKTLSSDFGDFGGGAFGLRCGNGRGGFA